MRACEDENLCEKLCLRKLLLAVPTMSVSVGFTARKLLGTHDWPDHTIVMKKARAHRNMVTYLSLPVL